MSKPIIEQKNEVIARFMGHKEQNEEWGNPLPSLCFLVNNHWHPVRNLKYHSDWSWLMEVWYKFRDLRFIPEMLDFKHSELKATIGHAILYGGIEIAHEKIYQGVQWYQKQNENSICVL